MGWTFTHRRKGFTDRDYFKNESGCFSWSDPSCADYQIGDTATVNRKVFHAVLEMNAERRPELIPDENGKVRIACVFLIKWVPRDHYNFGWKDMDEFMSPYESVCPEKILKQLSPFKPEVIAAAEAKYAAAKAAVEAGTERHAWRDSVLNAYDWRERCRKLIEIRKAALKPGTKFKVDEMRFSDGVSTTELTVRNLVRRGKNKAVFVRPDGMPVRLSPDAYGRLQLA